MSENRAIIEEIYVAFNGRDYENVLSHFTEDIEWIVAENSPFADRSPYHEAAAQFFHQCLSGPAEELVVFAPPFPKGVVQFPHPLGDFARFFPTGQQSH